MSAKVEIDKSFKSGFKLAESELRRLVDTISKRFETQGGSLVEKYDVVLKDLTRIESDDVSEILELENGGEKSISKLTCTYFNGTTEDTSDDSVSIQFVDPTLTKSSSGSIRIEATSRNRDWVFATVAELEDRTARIKFFSLSHWASESFFFLLITLIVVFGLIKFHGDFVKPLYMNEGGRAESLRAAYEAGAVTNGIEALIFLEEHENESTPFWAQITYVGVLLAVPWLTIHSLKFASRRIYSAYVFLWGDWIEIHQKQMSRVSFVVKGILLSIALSLVGSFLFEWMR